MVLREAAARPEVLLVKRRARTAFGTAYAFPGGVLEPADRAAHAYCAGRDRAAAGVESCLPVVVGEGRDERLLMPGDPGYPRAAADDREEPA